MSRAMLIFLLTFIASCASQRASSPAQDAFFASLSAHCGKAYEGKAVTDIPKGSGFDAKLIMHVRECSDTEIKIPFIVGEDRSRTWIITKTENGLRLKHDHRHEDGSPDKSTMYGGDTLEEGTAGLQSFPADQYSKELFIELEIPAALDNVWKLHLSERTFSYQLTRINSDRDFKVDFDLTRPVATPPAPWGHEP